MRALARCLSPGRAPAGRLALAMALSAAIVLVATAGAQVATAPDALSTALGIASSVATPGPNFEAGPVNALLLSPDGSRLCVLNTPDHRVEVYDTAPLPPPGGTIGIPPGSATVRPHAALHAFGKPPPSGPAGPPAAPGLVFVGAVFTGLAPVAMALDPDDEHRLFVSNLVSDTVSVVDLEKLQVVATIPVGDEPQGLAIAAGRLFVACARAPEISPAVGQLDPGPLVQHAVVVTDAEAPYARVAVVPVGAVRPRDVVAVGGTVFVIAQDSGNHTTLIDETQTESVLGIDQLDLDAFDVPVPQNRVLLRPEFSFASYARGWPIPDAGRIVFDSEHRALAPQLLDRDIVAIDAATAALLPAVTSGVGTTLLDVERNPVTGDLWVAGTEAHNRLRFLPNLRGAAIESRVTIATPGGAVQQVLALAPPLCSQPHAQPAVLAFSAGAHGSFAFVACLGTADVVVLDAVDGSSVATIATGEIPSGLAVDNARGVLYVFSRGDKTLRAYGIGVGGSGGAGGGGGGSGAGSFPQLGPAHPLSFDPEPLAVTAGRTHLYDARAATGHGNGTMSCASCHVFAHADQLAWDLGEPGGSFAYYYPDTQTDVAGFGGALVVAPDTPIVHPMKGPMVTQSLRGLLDPDTKDALPLHWRGERRTPHLFAPAFQGLLAGSGITGRQMQEFAGFLRSIRFAPNPSEPKDRVYSGLLAEGRDLYGMNPLVPGKPYAAGGPFVCISCHKGDFTGQTDFTGSRPSVSAGSFTQMFNAGQLRMLYEKDYRFVSGFGALHDGAVDGVRGFMDFHVPNGGLPTFGNLTPHDKDAISAFAKAWDSGLAPLVGAQFTWTPATTAQAAAFLDLAEAQARPPAGNVDLVLHGFRMDAGGALLPRGALYRQDGPSGAWGYLFDTGTFVDRSVIAAVVDSGVATFTFTCVPPGTGARLGLDRDDDGAFDWLELLAGTDPARPDTDVDGWLDGAEPALGGDPLSSDETLPDVTPPVVLAPRALEVFADIATISCRTLEPATVSVSVAPAAGGPQVASAAEQGGLRRVHDVIVEGLPPGTALQFTLTATDRGGNVAVAGGTFTTLPTLLHVGDITLASTGPIGGAGGPFTCTAAVLVLDQSGAPRAAVAVRGFWAGEIGGQAWEQESTSDAAGWATFTLLPFTPPAPPAAPTTVTFSPAYIGKAWPPADPWFVGLGGQTPKFFYDQTRNAAHYRDVVVP